MHRFVRHVGLVAVIVAMDPSPAAADWRLTPFLGGSLFDVTETSTQPTFGGSVAWVGSVAGFELDLGETPDLLESRTGLAIDGSNVFTLMGNAVVQFPTASRRLRPYVVGGIGVIHTKVRAPADIVLVEDENLGLNVGAGLSVFLTERLGVRGDLRYFRAIRNDDATPMAEALEVSELEFLRFTVGATFTF